MSAENGRENSEPSRQSGRVVSEPDESCRVSDPKILEQVLCETARTQLIGKAADGSSEHTALLDVARRYLGKPLELEPMVVDMVAAVLAERIVSSGATADGWRGMVSAVAETLYEDPPSRDRMNRLWNQLQRALACP